MAPRPLLERFSTRIMVILVYFNNLHPFVHLIVRWFAIGSFISMIIAIVPLAQRYITSYNQTDDALPRIDHDITWALLIICGFFYTVGKCCLGCPISFVNERDVSGSYAFVRAFEEPPKLPLLHQYKHFQTDELLGAWLFLFGTIPAVPYSLVYFSLYPGVTYMALLVMALVCVLGCVLFVIACYPSDRKAENFLLPYCIAVFGSRMWIIKHLANDWLAGTWFFLWASGVFTFASFILMITAFAKSAGPQQNFVWISGFLDSLTFLIGSLYFVAGLLTEMSVDDD